MPKDRLADYMAESAAAVLITADHFVRTLDGLIKGGEAVKHRGKAQELIGLPVAVVSIDSMNIDSALGTPWESFRRHELVLGVVDTLFRESTTTKRMYLDHEYIKDKDKFAKEGHLTGWRARGKSFQESLGFGGFVWSNRHLYVVDFIPEGKLSIPPLMTLNQSGRGCKLINI